MRTRQPAPKDIDEYIAGFPRHVQQLLQKIRMTIKQTAPDAQEAIKYQIPTFTLNGNLVFFAAFKEHVSVYPAPRGDRQFEGELAAYAGGKGTVRFPLDEPIPFDLIRRIVTFRVQENLDRAAAAAKKRMKRTR
jgi:uncharacterized protein YdhG (YjbR/CyaY superfamily)